MIASIVQFKQCEFSPLSGQFGGAVFLQNSADLEVRESEFVEIIVNRGVIRGYKATVGIYSSQFLHFTQSAISEQRMTLLVIAKSVFRQE